MEIMIVVVIIGILAALAIPAFQRVQRAPEVDAKIDDGDLATGNFILNAPTRVMSILARGS